MGQPPQPAQRESNIQPAPTQIPVDQQPSKEQLAKLFAVMHLSEQIKTLTQMMPAMIKPADPITNGIDDQQTDFRVSNLRPSNRRS